LIANPELWLEVVHPDDAEIAAASHHTLLAAGEASCEYRIRTRSGEVKWVSDRKRFIVDDERLVTMMGGILKDITADKERETLREASHLDLERQVAERTSELRRVNAELDAFARTIAHDLRAPLTTMTGFTQLVRKRYALALGEDGLKMMTRIDRSAKQMANLIDDLLSLSRASTAPLNIKHVDLVPLAREILEELQDQDPERKVRFEAPESLRVRADLGLVRPLLANLLSNAWKFTGKRDDACIRLSLESAAPEAVVRIQDNGVGFDTDQAQLIFKPFQRFHTLSEFSGTGIGLTTCERIVHRHGGRIWLESKLDEGTSVFFTLSPGTETVTPEAAG